MDKNKLEQIAKVCHQVNKVYCESIGDTSQPNWEEAPNWQKESAIKGVEYHLANPESKPSDSHESWMKEKIDTGWVYGTVKDPDKKEHPCMMPYDKLPVEQQIKDKLFLTIVRAFE